MLTLPDPPILVITDRHQCSEPLEARAESLFEGGCRWLSLREKDLAAAERRALLRRVMEIGDRFGARVGIHDDPAAALALGAALHLPAGVDFAAIRAQCGTGMPIGQSCHDRAEAERARDADYITLSPVFETASKPGYMPGLSLEDIAVIAGRCPAPVIALGGIGRENLPRLAGIPIAGIAVMGEAMRAASPAPWFRLLAARWREIGAP